MELAITIDAMEPFVKATYILEGDGALALVAYEGLTTLFAVITSEQYPNVAAVAKNLCSGDSRHERQLVEYAKACVVPAFTYFKSNFENDLKATVLAFKAARYFSPPKVNEIKPTAADIDSLRAIPFLDSTSTIDGLKAELLLYLAAAEDVSAQTDVLQWWKSHESELPKWAEACRLVLLMQPFYLCSHLQQLRNGSFPFSLTLSQSDKNHLWKIILNCSLCCSIIIVPN